MSFPLPNDFERYGATKLFRQLLDADVDGNPVLRTSAALTFTPGDIEIGAVEIKNSTDDTRATVGSNGLYVDVQSTVLATGAASSAKQDTGNTSLASIDSKLVLPSTLGQKAMAQSMAVVISSDQTAIPISGSITATNPSVSATGSAVPASATMIGGSDGTNLKAVKVSSTGVISVDGSATTQPVSAASLPLPTGASTSAKQDTGNTSLASIDTKLVVPATLGQKSMANSFAITIASDQSALPITGSITASSSSTGATGSAVPTDATMIGGTDGTNLRAVKVSSAGVVSVDGSATTQPVSASALPLPTGASTSAKQDTGNTSLASIDGKITAVNTGAVTISSALPAGANTIGAVNLAQYTPATGRLPVDGSGVTQPVSAASLPLPTGAATSAKQDTGNTSLGSIDTKLVLPSSLGQKAMANSLAITIASDQSALPITGSITASNASIGATGAAVPADATLIGGSDGTNLVGVKVSSGGVVSVDGSASTQPISASALPLPTGASTSAKQDTGNTSLASIDGKVTACNTGAVTISSALPAGGNTIGAVTLSQYTPATGRLPVDGSGVTQPISAAALPLPTGAATETTVSVLNTKITTIDADTGAGTDTRQAVAVVLGASGGGALLGTANPMPISDNGGSVTVDGTVTANIGTIAGLATESTLSTLNGKVTACNTGAVTIANASGGSAVNIQDGGNSITVDGTVTANLGTIAGVATETTLSALSTKITTVDADTGAGTDTRQAVALVLAESGGGLAVGSAHPMPISDNGGSVTVDGTITANIGTTNGLALDSTITSLGSLMSSGNTKTRITDGTNDAGVDATNGLKVYAAQSGTWAVTQATAASLKCEPVQTASANLKGQTEGLVASGATDSGNPVKVGAVYNSSAPTFTNGQRADLQANVNGSLLVSLSTLLSGEDQTNSVFACAIKPVSGSTYAATSDADFGTVVTKKIKNGAGNLLQIDGHNNNAATRYLQIHNVTAALSGTEVPIKSYLVPAGTQLILNAWDLGGSQGGLYCSTGITWAWSTTKNTYTAATAGDHVTTSNYV